MNIDQAITLVDNYLAQLRLTRAEQGQAMLAVQVIKASIVKPTPPVEPTTPPAPPKKKTPKK